MLRFLFKVGRWIYEVADIGVQLTVGWTVAFGALVAFVTGIWAFFLEWGPLSIPAACLAAIFGMMAFEDGQRVWKKWWRSHQKAIETLRELNRLSDLGAELVAGLELSFYDDPSPVPEETWNEWFGACERVAGEVSFEALYSLKTMGGHKAFYEQFRQITLQYAREYNFSASEVLGDVAR